jgi:hypothetical protein
MAAIKNLPLGVTLIAAIWELLGIGTSEPIDGVSAPLWATLNTAMTPVAACPTIKYLPSGVAVRDMPIALGPVPNGKGEPERAVRSPVDASIENPDTVPLTVFAAYRKSPITNTRRCAVIPDVPEPPVGKGELGISVKNPPGSIRKPDTVLAGMLLFV